MCPRLVHSLAGALLLGTALASPGQAAEPSTTSQSPATPGLVLVHIEQRRGATPVDLVRVSDINPDAEDFVCSSPCDWLVYEGTFRISGYDYRPSKRFRLRGWQHVQLIVEPIPAARARNVGIAVGALLPLAALVPLVVPFAVDMPLSHAGGVWALGSAIAVGGIIGGIAIARRRTKVRLRSRPL